MGYQFSLKKKKIKMIFGGVQIFASGMNVRINGKQLNPDDGYIKDGKSISIILFNSIEVMNILFTKAITIEKRGEFIHLKYSDGVRVKWHNDSMTIYVTVDEQYTGKVTGLCGHYDHNYEDDFRLPDGSYTNQANTFANSWRVDSSVSI